MLIGISKGGTTPPSDLVDLLVECHERIRRFIAMAHAAATYEQASATDVADACSRVQRYFTEALPLHVADEELSILPRLRGKSPEVDAALDVMKEQHGQHEELLSTFLRLVNAVGQKPSDALQKERLARATRELEQVFGEHLLLEESVILPAIGSLLPNDLRETIVDEIRRRRRRATLSSVPHPLRQATSQPESTGKQTPNERMP